VDRDHASFCRPLELSELLDNLPVRRIMEHHNSQNRAGSRFSINGIDGHQGFSGENARTQACTNSIVGARQR
jgi:hypothetical protein